MCSFGRQRHFVTPVLKFATILLIFAPHKLTRGMWGQTRKQNGYFLVGGRCIYIYIFIYGKYGRHLQGKKSPGIARLVIERSLLLQEGSQEMQLCIEKRNGSKIYL